jgi:hypothetical protein
MKHVIGGRISPMTHPAYLLVHGGSARWLQELGLDGCPFVKGLAFARAEEDAKATSTAEMLGKTREPARIRVKALCLSTVHLVQTVVLLMMVGDEPCPLRFFMPSVLLSTRTSLVKTGQIVTRAHGAHKCLEYYDLRFLPMIIV